MSAATEVHVPDELPVAVQRLIEELVAEFGEHHRVRLHNVVQAAFFMGCETGVALSRKQLKATTQAVPDLVS